MSISRENVTQSPLGIAASYAFFGVLWILITDQLIFRYVDDPVRVTRLQTLKGWVFVAVSALLVYGLVFGSQRNLRDTNARLDSAIQQTSILDRILRHNLRNSCNVIKAHAEMLERTPDNRSTHLAKIHDHNDRLIDLSKKSRHLRDIVLSESLSLTELDLSREIRDQIERVREQHPEAEITADLPEELTVQADVRLGIAVGELLENAIHHNEGPEPTVHVAVEVPSPDTARIEITDDGPGLPELEREVLEHGVETQMAHSQGLGLWIAHTLVERLGGEFTIAETTRSGTQIDITLPRRGPGQA